MGSSDEEGAAALSTSEGDRGSKLKQTAVWLTMSAASKGDSKVSVLCSFEQKIIQMNTKNDYKQAIK